MNDQDKEYTYTDPTTGKKKVITQQQYENWLMVEKEKDEEQAEIDTKNQYVDTQDFAEEEGKFNAFIVNPDPILRELNPIIFNKSMTTAFLNPWQLRYFVETMSFLSDLRHLDMFKTREGQEELNTLLVGYSEVVMSMVEISKSTDGILLQTLQTQRFQRYNVSTNNPPGMQDLKQKGKTPFDFLKGLGSGKKKYGRVI